jgi:hypothetical protein
MANRINLDLSMLKGGAVQEDINREYKRVAENLDDPNADNRWRKLTIELKFKNDQDNEMVMMKTNVKSVLAPSEDKTTLMMLGRNGMGNLEMNELRSSARGQTIIDTETGQLLDDKGEPLQGELADDAPINYLKK